MAQRSDRVELSYPRRRVVRAVLRWMAGVAFFLLARIEVRGRENLPDGGPVILAGNHFHFADPVALLHLSKRQVEFVGGFRFPNAPTLVKFFPRLWGYFPVHRGAYSRSSLDYATATLEKGGVVGIFPEGGAWAQVLRYPRSGVGFIAAESGAVVVPVALSGMTGLFNVWRPKIIMAIGKPIGPFHVDEKAAARKSELEAIGTSVMQSIASMLPPEERGVYAENDDVREAALKVAVYPFEQKHMRGM